MNFNGLHDCMSQEVELFITTPVRTSKPTLYPTDLQTELHELIILYIGELAFFLPKGRY
jgi:hypothetical protein